MKLSRGIAIGTFLLLTALFFVLFVSDAGNFFHGGTAGGLVLTQAMAAFGSLAYLEVLRSDASKLAKAALGLLATPLFIAIGMGVFYAAERALAV